jgi:hypothetical protein
LTGDQYAALIADFNFDGYSDDERAENLRLTRIKAPQYQLEKTSHQYQSKKPINNPAASGQGMLFS